jgi:hypothetical protein
MLSVASFVVAAVVVGQAPSQPSSHEHLKAFAPAIGTWVTEVPGMGKMSLSLRWTLNKNFIERSESYAGADGTTYIRKGIIGWDASTKQIRGWMFSQSGSIRRSVWESDGDQLKVKTTKIGPDGSKSVEEFTSTVVGSNKFVVESMGQRIEFKRQPSGG